MASRKCPRASAAGAKPARASLRRAGFRACRSAERRHGADGGGGAEEAEPAEVEPAEWAGTRRLAEVAELGGGSPVAGTPAGTTRGRAVRGVSRGARRASTRIRPVSATARVGTPPCAELRRGAPSRTARPGPPRALQKGCDKLINEEFTHIGCDHLFHCGAGNGSFNVSYDGKFRLCSSLWAPETMYDLRKGTLREAWEQLVPKVRDMRSRRREFLERCRRCPIVNLCLWCPAHSYLETGELDTPIDYFCQVAHARAAAIQRVRNEEFE